MGDGRYYSPEQFFSVMFLTVLVIFIVTRAVLIYFKGSGHEWNKCVLMINSVLGTMVMLSIFEQVLVSEKAAFLTRMSIGLLFVAFNFVCLFLLMSYYEELTQKPFLFNIKLSLLLVWCLVVFISMVQSKFFISTYAYPELIYGFGYLGILSGTFILVSSYLIKTWLYLKHHKKTIHHHNFIPRTLLIGWILPMVFYLYNGFYAKSHIVWVEYAMLLFLGIGISIIFELATPYRVSMSIFDDVKKYMLDYVFIVDEKGQVIYKNSSAQNSLLFKKLLMIDVNHLQPLFNKDIKVFSAYSKDIIQYDNDHPDYLSYSITKLTNDHQLGGYILTFSDITHLIILLDKLKEKQKETLRINRELEAYKDIVYDLEVEKEISALLSEIASNQQKSMEQLKSDIQRLMTYGQEDFEEAIEILIVKAKDDLRNVRESVTTYRAYYGGEHD